MGWALQNGNLGRVGAKGRREGEQFLTGSILQIIHSIIKSSYYHNFYSIIAEKAASMNSFKTASPAPHFYEQGRAGLSSLSKHYGYSNRSHEEHNLGEVEFMLDNERRKFKEAKDKFEHDLDSERKLRIQFENKLIKLKEEFSRKEVGISELEFKVNNLLHQNQDLVVENERLRTQMMRLEDLYGGKLHELEAQLAMETRNYDDMTNQYNTEFEKFKKEGQEYVEQITFDFQRKIKTLEERVKISELAKRDLTMENKKLNEILISNKLAFEEEVRELKNRAREEEVKKTQHLGKSFEQKLKMVENSKESIIRKNSELLRLLQDKDRQVEDLQNQKNEEISRLRQESSDFAQHNTHLNYLISKLKAEVSEKDNMLGRSYTDNDGELQTLKSQLEAKKQENFQLSSAVKDLRLVMKNSEGEWESKRRDLAERCNFFEREARKYKEEYERICEVLKSRINDTINNTVSYKK